MESLLYFWTSANVTDTHLQSTRNISAEISSFTDHKETKQEGQARARFTGKLYFKESER